MNRFRRPSRGECFERRVRRAGWNVVHGGLKVLEVITEANYVLNCELDEIVCLQRRGDYLVARVLPEFSCKWMIKRGPAGVQLEYRSIYWI